PFASTLVRLRIAASLPLNRTVRLAADPSQLLADAVTLDRAVAIPHRLFGRLGWDNVSVRHAHACEIRQPKMHELGRLVCLDGRGFAARELERGQFAHRFVVDL